MSRIEAIRKIVAQSPNDPVDVDGRETGGVGDEPLGERNLEGCSGRNRGRI